MLGFSRQEQKFVLFLLLALLFGLGMQYYIKSQPNKISEQWAVEYEKILKDFKKKFQEGAVESFGETADSTSAAKILAYDEKKKFVGKININTASSEELQTLTGIGPATASKIIEFRQNSGFNRIEDVQYVKGIGPKKFEKIKSNITIE